VWDWDDTVNFARQGATVTAVDLSPQSLDGRAGAWKLWLAGPGSFLLRQRRTADFVLCRPKRMT